MDTTDTTTADVKIPKYDVIALTEELMRLRRQVSADLKTPVHLNMNCLDCDAPYYFVHAAGECEMGSDLDAAVDRLSRRLSDVGSLIAEKRAAAERLLADAAKLEAEAAA